MKLAVAAPPEKGRANAEAERFLARELGVAAREVEIVRGASGRDKVALVRGMPGESAGAAPEAALFG